MKMYETGEGFLVGTQAEIPKGDPIKVVEVPTNPKEALIEFLNNRRSQPTTQEPESEPEAVALPEASPEDQLYASFRTEVIDGKVQLDEFLLAAPLDMSLRLLGLISERVREHFAKEKRSV